MRILMSVVIVLLTFTSNVYSKNTLNSEFPEIHIYGRCGINVKYDGSAVLIAVDDDWWDDRRLLQTTYVMPDPNLIRKVQTLFLGIAHDTSLYLAHEVPEDEAYDIFGEYCLEWARTLPLSSRKAFHGLYGIE